MNQLACGRLNSRFNELRSSMNDLTLEMYADPDINAWCNRLVLGEYANTEEYGTLEMQVRNRCAQYLYATENAQSLGIFLADERGTNIATVNVSLPLYKWKDSLRQQAYLDALQKDGALNCYDIGDRHEITFARALRDYSSAFEDIRTNGVIAVSIQSSYIRRMLPSVLSTPNGFAYLVNADGVVSYATDASLVGQAAAELPYSEQKHSGLFSPLVSSFPLESLQQQLVFVTPAKDLTLSSSSFTQTLIAFILLLAFLNILLVIVISRNLSRPMADLVMQLQTIGHTDTTQRIEADGYSEIVDISNNFNEMMDRVSGLMEENFSANLDAKNARIEALQSQINPHFIYNTLETINWKTMFLDVPEVTHMISALGEMLRYNTYYYGEQVSLEQEIAQIRNYLYIQKIRMDSSFEEYIMVEDAAQQMLLPCLLLQPLVENAILHGLMQLDRPGRLVVRAGCEEGLMRVSVFDNGQGMAQERIEEVLSGERQGREGSIGIANVHRRLVLTYGAVHGLQITSREGYYTRVCFTIPLSGEGR